MRVCVCMCSCLQFVSFLEYKITHAWPKTIAGHGHQHSNDSSRIALLSVIFFSFFFGIRTENRCKSVYALVCSHYVCMLDCSVVLYIICTSLLICCCCKRCILRYSGVFTYPSLFFVVVVVIFNFLGTPPSMVKQT